MISKDVAKSLIDMLEHYCDLLAQDAAERDALIKASQMLNFWRMYENFIPAEVKTDE